MSEDKTCEPELDRLAADWIALWQDELAALATDPEVVQAWQRAFGLGVAWLRAGRTDERATAPGAAAAGPAPGSRPGDPLGGADAALLLARIDALERRLAALEQRPAGGGADRRGPRRKGSPA